MVKISFPWNDDIHVFTGVPPHIALLQELRIVRIDQIKLIDSFVDKVKEALETFGVNADRLSENRLRTVLDEFRQQLREQMGNLDAVTNINNNINNVRGNNDRTETGEGYLLHYYNGKYHRVPQNWRFPRCGLQDLWRQWWIGDNIKNVPPLRLLQTIDIKHLDDLRIGPDEVHGRKGRFWNKRRATKKNLCDLRYIMRYVQQLCERHGESIRPGDNITITKIDNMYATVVGELVRIDRDVQKQWLSIVRKIRLLPR